MKYLILTLAALALLSYSGHAQNVGFTYQAVAIDESKAEGFGQDSKGEILVNKNIGLRFSLHEGAADGVVMYREKHETSTDIFGIFRVIIGRGFDVTGSELDELQWGDLPYFLEVEVDLGDGFQFLGIEELLGSPYSLNKKKQLLNLDQNILSITHGNSITLNDNNSQNELNTAFTISGTFLTITDAGGSRTVDLKDVAGGTLNEAEVDYFVSNNGFIAEEIDGSVTNELQTLSREGTEVTLSNGGGTVSIADADSDATNEIQALQLNGNSLTITNNPSAAAIDLSIYLDNTNLTEQEVDTFVGNNGYLLTEVDGSVTNEIQDLSTNGNPGNITISSGATLNINVNDADASSTNEIQDLSITNNVLSITNNAGATPISLTPYLDAAFRTNNNVTSNAPGDYATDDFVFGSPVLAHNGNSQHNSRMFFDKSKSAFRAGSTTVANIWDDPSIGVFSIAFGDNPRATNSYTFAFGQSPNASGFESIAMGGLAQATGSSSISLGSGNTASGTSSRAIGSSAIANGSFSVSAGRETLARSYGESVLGLFNTDYTASSASGFNSLDRIFVIGNGTGSLSNQRSNALVILKNGNTTLNGQLTLDADNVNGAGGSYTFPAQRGTNGQVMVTNGTGVLSWSTLPTTAFTTTSGVTSNAPGIYATDDFVFGAPALEYDGNSNHLARVSFDKSKGAFRAGAGGSNWSDLNVGSYSAGFGFLTKATGVYSTAFGNSTSATGESSFAVGDYAVASGYRSVALGTGSASGHTSLAGVLGVASAQYSIALGQNAQATAINSMALGLNTESTAQGAFAAGTGARATHSQANALGYYAEATNTSATSIGYSCQASGIGSLALGTGSASAEGAIAIRGFASDQFAVAINGEAYGLRSRAIGYGALANGDYSTAIGYITASEGEGAACLGTEVSSLGNYSLALGFRNQARAYGETVIGFYGTTPAPFNGMSYNALDRLFTIGNGTGSANRSDALVILKNGNATLNGQLTLDGDNVSGAGGSYTFPAQRGTNGQIMITDGNGILSWSAAPASSFTTATGVTSNSPGDEANDDFVFGSSQLSDDGDATHDSRFFFDKSKSAFRAGIATTPAWDDANIGLNSTAFGYNSTAIGNSAFAAGSGALAQADFAIALGSGVQATQTESIAMGNSAYAQGVQSIAIGSLVTASGDGSVAFGTDVEASSFHETALGMFGTAGGGSTTGWQVNDRLVTIGNGQDNFNRSDALVILKSGDATLSGIFTHASDWRLKRNIHPLSNSLSSVVSIRGVHYNWNGVKAHDTVSLETGFIAQEVEKIFPELVKTDNEGFKSVNYTGLIPHLVEAIKELKKENEDLRAQNSVMRTQAEQQVLLLEKRLQLIEAQVMQKQTKNANSITAKVGNQ